MRTATLKITRQQIITGLLLRQELTLDQAHDETLQPVDSVYAEFQKRHQRVLELKRHIGHSFWQMGMELKAIRDGKLYRAGGYRTFEQYLSSPEVSIDRSTAYDWIGIFSDFSSAGVGLSDIEDIDWRKLRMIRRIIREHPEQVAHWLAQARALSRAELHRALEKADLDLVSRPSLFTQLEECVKDLQQALGRGDIGRGIQTLREIVSFGQQLLEALEKLSRIEDSADPNLAPIQLGWRIWLWDEAHGDLLDVCLVANGTADVERGQISDRSPVGAALLGRYAGEEIKIRAPSGAWRKYRILHAEQAKDDDDAADHDTDAEQCRDLPSLAPGADREGLEEPWGIGFASRYDCLLGERIFPHSPEDGQRCELPFPLERAGLP
jgi:transcription elongation GreA/GreB family factor